MVSNLLFIFIYGYTIHIIVILSIYCMYVFLCIHTNAVPSYPVNLSISDITPTTFLIDWDPPTHPNGIILRYEVSYTGEDTLNDVPEAFYNTTIVTLSPNTTSLGLQGLEPYSVYNITARAVNGAGLGALSSEMGLLTRTEPFRKCQ